MIPFKEIDTTITQGLTAYTGVPVIELNSNGETPGTEFITYDLSGGLPENIGFPVYYQESGLDMQRETVSLEIDFMAHSDDGWRATELILLTQDWLKTIGRVQLKPYDTVVQDIGMVANRDILVADEWERRRGMTVELRTNNIASKPLEYIATADIKEE
jgi:hypothetical protein